MKCVLICFSSAPTSLHGRRPGSSAGSRAGLGRPAAAPRAAVDRDRDRDSVTAIPADAVGGASRHEGPQHECGMTVTEHGPPGRAAQSR